MKRLIFLSFFLTAVIYGDQFSQLQIQRELMDAEAQLRRAEQGWMTGNWDGWRYKLANKGVSFIASYSTDLVGNPVGGVARGFTYCGSFGLGLDIDFDRAVGIPGFEFFTSAVWRTGSSLTKDKIKNQFTVQQVFGSQEVKLNELFFQETLWEGRCILKAGRLDAGNDFLQSNLFYQFVNNAFCGNPVAIFNNFTFSAYPNATWGAYISGKPWKRILGKFAVYNANDKISKNKYHGVNFTFKSTQGVILVTEWGVQVNQERDDHGMPGNYRIGYVYQTGSKKEFLNGNVNGNSCVYVLLDQMIYRPGGAASGRSLTPFITLLFAPKDKNLFPFFTTSGLVVQGPFAPRPLDFTSFGIGYGRYSKDLGEEQQQEELPVQNYETVLEWNYCVQVNKWMTFAPDFQYIIRPRGLDIPNAFCLGAQISFIL